MRFTIDNRAAGIRVLIAVEKTEFIINHSFLQSAVFLFVVCIEDTDVNAVNHPFCAI